MGRIRSFSCPFEDRQLRIAAMDHDPVQRIFALFATNLTLVIRTDHRWASNALCKLTGVSVPAAATGCGKTTDFERHRGRVPVRG